MDIKEVKKNFFDKFKTFRYVEKRETMKTIKYFYASTISKLRLEISYHKDRWDLFIYAFYIDDKCVTANPENFNRLEHFDNKSLENFIKEINIELCKKRTELKKQYEVTEFVDDVFSHELEE